MSRGGFSLLVLLLLSLLAYHGREVLPGEGFPAFSLEKRSGIPVYLGRGFPRQGVYQFSDDTLPISAIALTGQGGRLCSEEDAGTPLRPGERLELSKTPEKLECFSRSWMPAGQRIALGIPLHPDRMSREDWEALPGIGPALAERILLDRQQNGDFHSLSALRRVRGVGPARIKAWEEFFLPE